MVAKLGDAVAVRENSGTSSAFGRALTGSLVDGDVVQTYPLPLAATRYGYAQRLDAEWLGNSVVVLDPEQRTLTEFAMDGAIIGHVAPVPDSLDPNGRFFPVAVLASDAGRVLVLDLTGDLYPVDRSGPTWSWNDAWPLSVPPRSVCDSGEHLFVQGTSGEDARTLRQLSRTDGEELRAFAEVYRADHPRVVDRVTRGRVVCLGGEGPVVEGFEMQNRLEAFSPVTGERLWTSVFVDIAAGRVIEDPDGGVRFGIFDEPLFFFLARLTTIDDAHVLVQFGVIGREDFVSGQPRYSLRSYLVDAMSGEGEYLGDSIPEVLRVRDGIALLIQRGGGVQLVLKQVDLSIEAEG